MPSIASLSVPERFPAIKLNPEICTETFDFTLETPLMGGGIEGGELNHSMPVRSPSVRGNLREWWRIFCAAGITGNALRSAEAEIWGSAEKNTCQVSKVKLSVKSENITKERDCENNFDFSGDNPPELYALFPVLPNQQQDGTNIAKEGLKFSVTITYPESKRDEIYLALSGWVNFGGIGSRTRRGLGTLSCKQKLPGIHELLQANPAIKIFTRPAKDALNAWHNILELYRDFRQQRNNYGTNHPGRSYFPEPDSLRLITQKHSPRHGIILDEEFLPSFPRAALGLPIIFHFKDERVGDPYQVLLKPSPVITKAIMINSQWHSALIILPSRQQALDVLPVPCNMKSGNAIRSQRAVKNVQDEDYLQPHQQALNVRKFPSKIKSGNETHSELVIKDVKNANYSQLPHNPLRNSDNAIDGFINYILANKFQEVNA